MAHGSAAKLTAEGSMIKSRKTRSGGRPDSTVVTGALSEAILRRAIHDAINDAIAGKPRRPLTEMIAESTLQEAESVVGNANN